MYRDSQDDKTFFIILNLIRKLWNRVQATILISLVGIGFYLYSGNSYASFVGEIVGIFAVWYNITLTETMIVYSKMKNLEQ